MTQSKSREQKLIDIMFEVAQISRYHFGKMENYDRDKHMEWVAEQLRICGFDTEPRGLSWGVLKE
jgi:hypothetical protein